MYRCECGKIFELPNSFNGHKGHCKIHLKIKYGTDEQYERIRIASKERYYQASLHSAEIKKQAQVKKAQAWLCIPHYCEHCGKRMLTKYGSGRYCDRSCANSHTVSDAHKQKLREKAKARQSSKHVDKTSLAKQLYANNPKHCKVCRKVMPFEIRYRKTCCDECLKVSLSMAGRHAAYTNRNGKRSKNEIYFCELCEKTFENVIHNAPIFNGWDADVIIEDLKYAVLWNGPWHYKEVLSAVSLAQIQNRDRIKQQEIKKADYKLYIINDPGKANKYFVEAEFNKFLEQLKH